MARPTINPDEVLRSHALSLNRAETDAVSKYAYARGIYTTGNSRAARELVQLGLFLAESLQGAGAARTKLLGEVLCAPDAPKLIHKTGVREYVIDDPNDPRAQEILAQLGIPLKAIEVVEAEDRKPP